MLETLFTLAGIKTVLTALILIGAVYGFISEKIPPDITSLLSVIALLLTGILTPEEAFSGFSHPATVSVAAVLVLSAGIERTGILAVIARRVLTPLGKSELILTLVIMSVIALLSAFINNTAAVAIFIPVVMEVCRRTGASPGRILLPMSHAATFGGLCTLIGTSTNIVAHSYARSQGLPGFSMFSLGQVGLPMLVCGFIYILLIGRWFLPRKGPDVTENLVQDHPYVSELFVSADSPWIGRAIDPDQIQRDFDVELAGVIRRGRVLNLTEPGGSFIEGDSLRVRGALDTVLTISGRDGLRLHRPQSLDNPALRASNGHQADQVAVPEETGGDKNDGDKTGEEQKAEGYEHLPLAEVVVLPTSGLIGRTLKGSSFAERHNAAVLALKRRGDVRDRPSTTPLQVGDVLVVEGTPESLQALSMARGFLVTGTPAHPERRNGKLMITLPTLLIVITVVALGWLPMVTAAVAGCAVLILFRCLQPREAYQAIDMGLVFILAGTLALGQALEKTGITAMLATGLASLTGRTSPYVLLACFFLTAMVISEFMSNSGTVALLGPITISSAVQMGINPMSLLAAVTFGASAAFAMPMGYQTNLMIYEPGGYRMSDFVKMGIVLDILLAVIALWLIPHFWPLYLQPQ